MYLTAYLQFKQTIIIAAVAMHRILTGEAGEAPLLVVEHMFGFRVHIDYQNIPAISGKQYWDRLLIEASIMGLF